MDCHIHQSFSCCDKKKEKPTPPTPPTTSGCNISCPISGSINRRCDDPENTPFIFSAQPVPIVVNVANSGGEGQCDIEATLSGPDTSVTVVILPGEKKTLANQSATTLTINCTGGQQCRGTYDGCIVIC